MANVVKVTFEIDQDEKGRQTLRQIDTGVDKVGKTAKQASTDVDKFVNGFKTAIVIEFFRRGASEALDFGKAAVDAFNQAQKAALGLQSAAQFRGLDSQSVQEQVKNLQIVKDGLISFGQASQAAQNLLLRGFSLEQTLKLLNAFGDSAAFNRQAALSFGDAVVSTSEGIKNLNSILSDNGGITKNLSVILKERGFELQDVDDKVKGAAAREALYQGLLKETAAQTGNAAKLTNTFAGEQAKLEIAQTKLLQTIGEIIVKNPEVNQAFKSIGTTLQFITTELNDTNSALRKFVDENVRNIGLVSDAVAKLVRGFEALAVAQRIAREASFTGVVGVASQEFFGAKNASNAKELQEGLAKINQSILDEISKTPIKAQAGAPVEASKEAVKQQEKDLASLTKANEDYFKRIDELNKKYASDLKASGDAVQNLEAKLSVNPLVALFNQAENAKRDFLDKFQQVPQEIKAAFQKANQDALALDLFRGVIGQAGGLNRLLSERASLSEGGALFQGFAAKEARDNQLRQAEEFLGLASNAAQRQLALQNILDITSGGDLNSSQLDIRRRALDQSIAIQSQVFKENFDKLKDQSKSIQNNTDALAEVGNRLVAVESSLLKFGEKPLTILLRDESNTFTAINLGTID